MGTAVQSYEATSVQRRADRVRAYTELKGEQAELLLLLGEMVGGHDKAIFYEIRSSQADFEGTLSRSIPALKGMANLFTRSVGDLQADALQMERNSERYNDQLVSCAEKIFGSIALAQIAFAPDPILSERIANVESMLTRVEDLVPHETPGERMRWSWPLKTILNEHCRNGLSGICRT